MKRFLIGALKLTRRTSDLVVDIPLHPDLVTALEVLPRNVFTFLQTAQGKSRSPNGLGNMMRHWCDAAGLPGCTSHGLRKACARRLAEAGATTHEIAAVIRWFKRQAGRIRHIHSNKYSSDRLRNALSGVLGERRIGEATTRLVIPAWNPGARAVYIYKTSHHPRLRVDYKSMAVDAAMATASAPTYFRQHMTENDVGLIDGGIWANNLRLVNARDQVLKMF